MSTPLKLAGFAAVLVLVFGAASVAGGAIGPDREGAAERRAETEADGHSREVAVPDGGMPAGHGNDAAGAGNAGGGAGAGGGEAAGGHGAASGGEHGDAAAVRGLAVVDGGLRLALARGALARGRETELRFSIRDAGGRAVRAFDVTHEKRMHLIVVRRDGRGFQHLHPRLAGGQWRTRLALPQAGSYRVFADFQHDGRAYTLAADLEVDGAADYRPFPAPASVDRTDGYEVRLDQRGSRLDFAITRGGRPVETEPYLGAGGHLVALREGDLAFLHVHPEGHGVAFETDLDRGTRYRLYLQFKHDGRVHTAEFTR